MYMENEPLCSRSNETVTQKDKTKVFFTFQEDDGPTIFENFLSIK